MHINSCILLDIDGVILDTKKVFETILNSYPCCFGLIDKVEFRINEDWENPLLWGVSPEMVQNALRNFYIFFDEAVKHPFGMIKNADIAIDELKKIFDKVVFCTSRPSFLGEDTRKQLECVLGEKRLDGIEICHKNFKFEKVHYVEEYNAFGLIDDMPKHINSVNNAGYNGILFEGNWNQTLLKIKKMQ